MAANTRIFVPRYISDVNYNPTRVNPHIYFYNGQRECEPWYIEGYSGSATPESASVVQKTIDTFPQLDNYSKQIVDSSSLSLLFNNEFTPYGAIPSQSLYSEYWSNYVNFLYDEKTRVVTCSAIIPLADYFKMNLNDVVEWRGNYYYLRAINDYNTSNGECNLQLIGPIIDDTLNIEVIPQVDCSFDFTAVTPTTSTTSTTSTTTLGPGETTTTTTSTSTTSTSTTTEAPTISKNGLTLWNRCSSLSGSTWKDASGNGNDALISGSLPLVLSGSLGVEFVSSSSNPTYLTYPASLVASPSSSYTLQFYGSPKGGVGDMTLFGKSSPSSSVNSDGWFTGWNGNHNSSARFYYYDKFTEEVVAPSGVAEATRSLFTFVFEEGTTVPTLYVNNDVSYSFTSGPIVGFNTASSVPFTFGYDANSGTPNFGSYVGTISDIMVYNRVLSQSEINQNYFYITSQSCVIPNITSTTSTTSTSTTTSTTSTTTAAPTTTTTSTSTSTTSTSTTTAPPFSTTTTTSTSTSTSTSTTSTTTSGPTSTSTTQAPPNVVTANLYSWSSCNNYYPGSSVWPDRLGNGVALISGSTLSLSGSLGLEFNGIDNYLTYTSDYTGVANRWSLVIAGSFYNDGINRDLFAKDDYTNGWDTIWDALTDRMVFRDDTGGDIAFDANNSGSVKQVYTFTLNASDNVGRIYKNGTLLGGVTGSINQFRASTIPLKFGWNGNTDATFFKGTVTDLMVYGSILTSAEINQNYNALINKNCSLISTTTSTTSTTTAGPTSTSTTSTTRAPGSCVTYRATNNGGGTTAVTYVNCYNVSSSVNIGGGTFEQFCAKFNTPQSLGDVTFTVLSGCSVPTTTSTSTTSTSTSTTTAGPACVNITFQSNVGTSTSISWTTCAGNNTSYVLSAFETLTQCGLSGSASGPSGDVTITYGASCATTSTTSTTSTSTTTSPFVPITLVPSEPGNCTATGPSFTAYTSIEGNPPRVGSYILASQNFDDYLPEGYYSDGTNNYSIIGNFGTVGYPIVSCSATTTTTTTAAPTTTSTSTSTTSTTTLGPGETTTTTTSTSTTSTSTTSTSTTTAAPTCDTFRFVNETAVGQNIYWVDCNGNYTSKQLAGFETFYVCGLNGTAGEENPGDVTITNMGLCSLTTTTSTTTSGPTTTTTLAEWYGYNLFPVFGGTCDRAGDDITAYKYNIGGSIVTGDVLYATQNLADPLFSGYYSDGGFRYEVSTGIVTDKTACPVPTTTTTTTQACTAMSFSFSPSSNNWSISGSAFQATGSTSNYYIVPQRTGASFPQTYVYSASGSVNRETPAIWICSSSVQPAFTASVTWNNVPDSGTSLFHNWAVSGSNCAGLSQIAILTVNVTAAGGCNPMEYSFEKSPTGWSNLSSCKTVVTGSTHNYFIEPQRVGASFPQTYLYSALGSTNLLETRTWVVSSSVQATFTASVTWDNVPDTAGQFHFWAVTGSNCAGISAFSTQQINTYPFFIKCDGTV